MNRFTVRKLLVGACAATVLVLSGAAVAQEHMSAQAKFCDDFDHNVIMAGKVDEASRYLTNDFKEHNAMLASEGLQNFEAKLKAMHERMFARRGAGGQRAPAAAPHRTVLTQGDLVVFITPQPARPDPAHPGQLLPSSNHFDVYRMRDGKIAEHWD